MNYLLVPIMYLMYLHILSIRNERNKLKAELDSVWKYHNNFRLWAFKKLGYPTFEYEKEEEKQDELAHIH